MNASTSPLHPGADGPATVSAAPSALSQLHPDLVTGTARLYADAGFTPAEVLELPGDETFNAEVAGIMAGLLAGGTR
jgi:hypothetical protein